MPTSLHLVPSSKHLDLYIQRELNQQTTTSHRHHRRHREDGFRALLRRSHNNRALAGCIDSVPHSHSQLYVEQLVIVADQILVCARDLFLVGRSRKFANHQHMSLLLVAGIDVVAGPHILQPPVGKLVHLQLCRELLSYLMIIISVVVHLLLLLLLFKQLLLLLLLPLPFFFLLFFLLC